MSDYEVIECPNGTKLCYVDDEHSYWRFNPDTGKRGRRLTGVTTVARAMDIDPSNLMKWAARTNCIGVAELFKMQGIGAWIDSGESIWEELVAHALTYDDVRDSAATVGTNVHELAMQALGEGKPVPILDEMTEQERGHAHGIMAFWLDYEPRVYAVEQIVYSERLGVAGRLDLIAEIKGRINPGVIDLKTGGYIGASAHVQVGGGYPLLAEESGFKKPAWSLIVQTRDDGTYNLIECEATPEDFEAAVTVYRAAGRINGAATKARKARQAVAA